MGKRKGGRRPVRKRRRLVQLDLVPPGPAVRTTFSLPAPLANSIAAVARRLRVSRSALVVQLLTEPLADLQQLVELVPPGADKLDGEQARRLRGASADLVARRVADAIREVGGK